MKKLRMTLRYPTMKKNQIPKKFPTAAKLRTKAEIRLTTETRQVMRRSKLTTARKKRRPITTPQLKVRKKAEAALFLCFKESL